MLKEKDLIGYQGIFTQKGIYVEKDQAFDYVTEQINSDSALKEEFRNAMVDWFFSGDFIKVFEGDKEET